MSEENNKTGDLPSGKHCLSSVSCNTVARPVSGEERGFPRCRWPEGQTHGSLTTDLRKDHFVVSTFESLGETLARGKEGGTSVETKRKVKTRQAHHLLGTWTPATEPWRCRAVGGTRSHHVTALSPPPQ